VNPKQNVPWAADSAYSWINLKSFTDKRIDDVADVLNQAIRHINLNAPAYGTIYIPPGNYTIRTNCTIPRNVQLEVDHGAVFTVLDGVTFTISGQHVPVGWFGAKGDGVNDDAAAINAAAKAAYAAGASSGVAADNGQVYLPPGAYSISETIDLTDYPGVTLYGAGAGQALPPVSGTRLLPTGDFPAVRLGNTSGITVNHNPVHHYLHDFQIYGTSTGTSQHGIVIGAPDTASYQAAFNVIERVLIWNCGGDGIRFLDNAWTNTVRDCQIYANDGNGITALDESNTNLIIACKVNNNGGDGIYMEGEVGRGIYGFDLVSVEANANTRFGINVSNEYCYGVNIMGCYVENNQSGQLNNAGNSTTVSGGRWMQQAASVVEATTDIITWSGKYGGMWGGWLQYDCRYAINAANSDRATFSGVGLDVNSGGGAFLDYYNLNGATGYIINNQNNRVTVPNLIATGAASPKLSAIDTTNDLEVVLQAGDTEGTSGTSTNHAFYLQTNGTRRLTIDANGNIAPGTAALATNATTGHFYIPTCAGTPTGVPTTFTGRSSLIFDTTNNKLYVYDGGWVDAGFDTNFDMFNVKAYGAVGDGSTNDTTAINAAIAAANAVATLSAGNDATGATVYFPPGLYLCNSALTSPTYGVRLLGAGGRIWGGTIPHASVLKMGFQNAALFSLGNGVVSNITFENLGFDGGQASTVGADLAHRGIHATAASLVWIQGCSFVGFGGEAIRIEGGIGKWIEYTQTTRVLLGYSGLASQSGGVYIAGTENNMTECNFNGPAFTASTHNEYGTGLAAALYVNGAPCTFYKVVGAFAQVGIVIGDSVGSSPSFFTNCRAEFNQGHGWVNLGANVCNFVSCSAYDNNRDTSTPTYSGFYGVSSTGFARNTFTDCVVTGIDGTYIQLYGFTDQNNGGGNVFAEANRYNAGCRAPGLTVFNPTFGACPPIIDRINRRQALTGSTASTEFDGEEGNLWVLTCASGQATEVNARNLLPGNEYELYIIQHATPGTVTLSSEFSKTATFSSPAASKHLSGKFRSDGTNLFQIGAWSGDM
jgi:hypothetical protein